ncbi:MAG: thioredoxin [Lentisphaerae bacterium]|nr:thioredoxin [Lentisphaerota bacterium]
MKLGILPVCALVLCAACSKKTPPEGHANTSPAGPVVVLDDKTFDSQIASGVVLVDFWATWCGPCRMQGPIVEQVAGQVQGKAKVAKLDVDSAQAIAQRFGISSIPTLIVFKDGKPADQFVGVTQADALIAAINKAAGPAL